MALTNAERQARFQKRLREKARGESLPQMARQAVEDAVRVWWAVMQRGDHAGWQEDMASVEEAIAYLGTKEGQGKNPAADLILMFGLDEENDGVTAEELAILNRAIALVKAVTLQRDS
jgi:hypothetical protein